MFGLKSQPMLAAAVSLTALVGVGAFGHIQPPAGPPPAANAEAPDPLGPDLFTAITRNDTAAMKAVLDKGARVEGTNWLGLRPLEWAALRGNPEACALLMDYKANLNSDTPFGGPLEAAALGGNPKVVQLLLDRGATPTKCRMDRMTALTVAAEAGNLPVARLLAEKVDVNAQSGNGMTALSEASRRGQTEIVRLLLAKNADAKIADQWGRTPLMYAAMNGHTESVRALLAHGAEPKAKDKTGDDALMLAARYSGQPEVAKHLLAQGADPKATDAKGRTAGVIAAQRGYKDFARLLPGAPVPAAPSEQAFPKRVEEAVRLSLPLIEKTTGTFSQRIGCSSCHHQGVGLQTTGIARAHGFAINEEQAKGQQKVVLAIPEASVEDVKKVSPHPELYNRVPSVDMAEFNPGTSSTFNALVDQDVPRSEAIEQTTLFLARQQSPDGSWAFGLKREPLQSSTFTYTAYAVRLMNRYMPTDGAKERDERIARAVKWLIATPAVTNEDRSFRLLALKWAGAPEAEVSKAAAELRKTQRADGGWAQFTGPNVGGPSYLLSDAYATGEALYALHVGGGVAATDATYRRGVQYLLRTQDDDGSWYVNKRATPVNNFLDFGFPHGESQYISYSATCWSTMALIYASGKM